MGFKNYLRYIAVRAINIFHIWSKQCAGFITGTEAGQVSFLWGHLNKKFCHIVSKKVEEMIREEIDATPPQLTQRVMDNFWEWLHQCTLLLTMATICLIYKKNH